jgi:hypothetical protein
VARKLENDIERHKKGSKVLVIHSSQPNSKICSSHRSDRPNHHFHGRQGRSGRSLNRFSRHSRTEIFSDDSLPGRCECLLKEVYKNHYFNKLLIMYLRSIFIDNLFL